MFGIGVLFSLLIGFVVWIAYWLTGIGLVWFTV